MTQDISQMTAPELVSELYALRLQLKILESAEKSVLEKLKPMVDPQLSFVEEKSVGIILGDYLLTRTQASTSRIDKTMLLEHGIPPEVISHCTKVTPYFTYKVAAKS